MYNWLVAIPDVELDLLGRVMIGYVYELSKGYGEHTKEAALKDAVLAEIVRRGRDPYA